MPRPMLPALTPKAFRPSLVSFAKFTPTHGLMNPSARAGDGQPTIASVATSRRTFHPLRMCPYSFVGEEPGSDRADRVRVGWTFYLSSGGAPDRTIPYAKPRSLA